MGKILSERTLNMRKMSKAKVLKNIEFVRDKADALSVLLQDKVNHPLFQHTKDKELISQIKRDNITVIRNLNKLIYRVNKD